MALRLEIISPQRQKLGSRSSIVLGVGGGSIGRALDNDWALPDSQRFLSGHHARIQFRGDHYVIEDTSSNGVFINDASKPLGRRGSHRLAAGDILRMGDYRVLVQIDEDDPAAVPPPGAATMANLTVQKVVPLRVPSAERRAINGSDEDLGHSLDIETLIPSGPSGPYPRPSTAGQREISETGLNATGEGAYAPAAPGSMQDRVNRLRAAARARLEGTSPSLALQGSLQAFCRGAGINYDKLPATSEAQALYLAGRLLRETLAGLREILRAQQAFNTQYGIRQERPEGPSPLDAGVDEYLLELLQGHEQRRLDAVLRLRDQFTEAARHAGALDPALRSALLLFIGHLDPARMDGLPPETSWARYREIYAHLLRASGGKLPHLFVEALAQAWLEARGGQR